MVKVTPQDNFLRQIMIDSELPVRAKWRVDDRFNIRCSEAVIAVTLPFRDKDFEDAICDAVDRGILIWNEYHQIMGTAMIIRGMTRDTDKETYVAVESSFTIGDSDIVRANRTTAALKKVFPDADARAAVYCAEISDENTQRAQDDGVEVISNARM